MPTYSELMRVRVVWYGIAVIRVSFGSGAKTRQPYRLTLISPKVTAQTWIFTWNFEQERIFSRKTIQFIKFLTIMFDYNYFSWKNLISCHLWPTRDSSQPPTMTLLHPKERKHIHMMREGCRRVLSLWEQWRLRRHNQELTFSDALGIKFQTLFLHI